MFGGSYPSIKSICITNSGNIVVAGYFSNITHSSIPGGSIPATGIAYININSGLITAIPVTIPVYPVPTNPYASFFANLTPGWGLLKYNPTTDTVYASMVGGGVMDLVANTPIFGIAAYDGTTLNPRLLWLGNLYGKKHYCYLHQFY